MRRNRIVTRPTARATITVTSGSGSPVNTTRASTTTSALSNTAAIMPGIAMPESFNAKPSTATTSSASTVARAVRHALEQRVAATAGGTNQR